MSTTEQPTTTPVQRSSLRLLGDLYAFIRGNEANQAIATVTHEQLIEEQIRRNGESTESSNSQNNPYSFDPSQTTPASAGSVGTGQSPVLARANFLGGSDVNLPTKVDQILAMKNEVVAMVKELKKIAPLEASTPPAELSEAAGGDVIVSTDVFEV